ncbi:MAG TPA: class I SAM-dependent methyltransferase [Thermoleophilaceae bacterium]|nr:class I SAM-dependent methyltransferase [Thermoleophilaceae bacterium]
MESQPLMPRSAPIAALRGLVRLVLRDDFARVQVGLTELRHRRLWRRSPVRHVTKRWVEERGLSVRGGPFAGLEYDPSAVGFAEVLVAKLIGAYERELHPAIRAIQADEGIDTVVNIGCAEGYYAVGLARSVPRLRVHAYDLSPIMQRLCRRMAVRNGVAERIAVRSRCDLDELRALAGPRALILADCEGCELELLRPDAVPGLCEATVLVELHDFEDPDTTSTILQRFEATHSAEVITAEPRFIVEHPEPGELRGISPLEHELALLEFRPNQMRWAVLRPRGA